MLAPASAAPVWLSLMTPAIFPVVPLSDGTDQENENNKRDKKIENPLHGDDLQFGDDLDSFRWKIAGKF